MARAYLSLGSNIDREHYVTIALDNLSTIYGDLKLSSVFESEPLGFQGGRFYNMAVGIDTSQTVGELVETLLEIENDCERNRDTPRFSSRTLDLDLLIYADLVGLIDNIYLPRKEIIESAFVLCPLAEIAGDDIHPITKLSYAELWSCFDKGEQGLWPVDFTWNGELISTTRT